MSPRALDKAIYMAALVVACGQDPETSTTSPPLRRAIPREVETEPIGDAPAPSDEESPGVVRLLGLTRAVVSTRVTESSSVGVRPPRSAPGTGSGCAPPGPPRVRDPKEKKTAE